MKTQQGILEFKGDKIINIIEKPKPEDAPSCKGAAGIYIVSYEIFNAIHQIKPGYNNEYQLGDAIKLLIDRGRKVIYKPKLRKIIGNN